MASQLPVEVVTHIFRFLSVSDRKDASLVCSTWYEASLDPILLKDTIVMFSVTSSVTQATISNLGRRKVPNLQLDNIDGSKHSKALVMESCKHMCANLQSLCLKGSDITECNFVTILSHCYNLENLDLSCCNSLFMSGQLLSKETDVQKLKPVLQNVRQLSLASIRYLSDAAFNRLTGLLTKVNKLSLAGCQITFHSDAYYTGHSKNANNIILTQTNIMIFICKHAESLKSLDFSRTTISNEALEDLAHTFGLELENLELISCKELTDEGIRRFCKKQQGLKSLNLSQCVDLTDHALVAICENLSQLQSLDISRCRYMSDKSISRLHLLEDLRSLNASACYSVTSSGLTKGLCNVQEDNSVNDKTILTSSEMTQLILNSCSSVLDDFVQGFSVTAALNMQHLDLRSCLHITDHSVHCICRFMKNLQVLRLAWCKELTDCALLGINNPELGDEHEQQHRAGLCKCSRKEPSTDLFKKVCDIAPREDRGAPVLSEKFVMKSLEADDVYPISDLTKLRVLDISNLPKITDVGVKQAVRFKELKSLYMVMCQSLTDASLVSVADKVPSLEELHVSQCPRITDAGVIYAARRLRRLTSLEIAMCDNVTNATLVALGTEKCGSLQRLDVSMCGAMTADAVETLESTLPRLQSVQKRLVGGASKMAVK